MKKYSVPMIVFGGALAAFGLFSRNGFGWWPDDAKIEIAIGVGLLILGIILYKEKRDS
jgi:hypothetical protein